MIDRGDHGEGAAKYSGALLVSVRHVFFFDTCVRVLGGDVMGEVW